MIDYEKFHFVDGMFEETVPDFVHSKLFRADWEKHDRELCECHSHCSGHGKLIPLSYFSFQPVLHDWCNKGRGMCYPVCGMVHIKVPLLLIEKSSPCGGSGFPLAI